MAGDGVITKRHSDKRAAAVGLVGRSPIASHLPETFSDRTARTPRPTTPAPNLRVLQGGGRPTPTGPCHRRTRPDRQDPLPACYLDDEPYRRRILTQLRLDGYPVEDADVERLSPLTHDHINLLGRYHFTNPDNRGDGRLRPLRDPRTARGLKAAITTP